MSIKSMSAVSIRRLNGLRASYPKTLAALNAECLETVAIKLGGAECGPQLDAAIPLLNSLLKNKKISGDLAVQLLWKLCGRGTGCEKHNTGIRYSSKEAAKAAMVATSKVALHSVQLLVQQHLAAPLTKAADKAADKVSG
jgi:hypothetical protein